MSQVLKKLSFLIVTFSILTHFGMEPSGNWTVPERKNLVSYALNYLVSLLLTKTHFLVPQKLYLHNEHWGLTIAQKMIIISLMQKIVHLLLAQVMVLISCVSPTDCMNIVSMEKYSFSVFIGDINLFNSTKVNGSKEKFDRTIDRTM